MNKKFRAVQKVVDREVSHVSTAISELNVLTENPSATSDDVIASIDAMAQKINSLKRKVPLAISIQISKCFTPILNHTPFVYRQKKVSKKNYLAVSYARHVSAISSLMQLLNYPVGR